MVFTVLDEAQSAMIVSILNKSEHNDDIADNTSKKPEDNCFFLIKNEKDVWIIDVFAFYYMWIVNYRNTISASACYQSMIFDLSVHGK